MTEFRYSRRLALLAVACGAWPLSAPAQGKFPSAPIALLVPWPAGGGTDLTMRILAEQARTELGQPVIVQNRPGAAGTLAMPALLQAPPNGYTIAQMPQTVFRAPHTRKVLWHPVDDVTPILQLSGTTFGVVVADDSPFQTLADVLDWARKNPGRLSVATNGVGSSSHLVMEELLTLKGTPYVHLPYKGTSEQMLAVASRQIMVGVNSTGFAPYVESGQLRLLVTFGAQRTKRWPQTPTLTELGYPIVAMSPYGLAGPRDMPTDIVQRLHDAFKKALFSAPHVAELAKYDQEPSYLGPQDYGRSMQERFIAERHNVERLGLGAFMP